MIFINSINKSIGRIITKIINLYEKYKCRIIIFNFKKIKLNKHIYIKHTNYPGGLKKIKINTNINNNRNFFFLKSIKKMKKNIKLKLC
ncbi:hypothetical protein ACT2CR_00090 [Candidatus Vidania fulgoroideorum]